MQKAERHTLVDERGPLTFRMSAESAMRAADRLADSGGREIRIIRAGQTVGRAWPSGEVRGADRS